MDYTSFVFLLGGHDLEMNEISDILASENIPFYDKNLKRNNALLSMYGEELNNWSFFVGVELQTDIKPPEQYLPIYYHDNHVGSPSVIEQVARLLDIELTREQQLVAATNKGDIPVLFKLGATPEEVANIHRRDREAQGVTEEDERLAEKSLSENLTTELGVTVVKSLTSKFSTTTDRLYPCEQLLIYNDDGLTYST
jgi:hypothetical protein